MKRKTVIANKSLHNIKEHASKMGGGRLWRNHGPDEKSDQSVAKPSLFHRNTSVAWNIRNLPAWRVINRGLSTQSATLLFGVVYDFTLSWKLTRVRMSLNNVSVVFNYIC